MLIPAIWMMAVVSAFTQPSSNPYHIEGDEIVFVFDVRQYAAELKTKGDKLDFADLKIHEVAITGQFNNWSKEGWRMLRKSEFLFELRKKIEDFNHAFPIQFKYIINGKYISAPEGPNSGDKQYTNDFLEEVYKLDVSVIKVHEQGAVTFFLKGFQGKSKVVLAGSFNGWDEKAIEMKKRNDGWYLKADLPPGRYEYKFIVDGEWMHDPAAKENVVNEHSTLNSVLYVKKSIHFTLDGFPNAQTVILTGSFVDWHEKKLKMTKTSGSWQLDLPLPGGKHHYKFIVDGKWYTDPANPIVEDDGYGNLNSVLFVH